MGKTDKRVRDLPAALIVYYVIVLSLFFFFQFFHTGGRWQEFLRECPLTHTGNRGSGAPKVMGTILLSVLCGHRRYAHINGVRGASSIPVC